MTPTTEAPVEPVDEVTPTHRRLKALAGPGAGYIFVVVPPEGDVSIDFAGLARESIADGLHDIADYLAAQIAEADA